MNSIYMLALVGLGGPLAIGFVLELIEPGDTQVGPTLSVLVAMGALAAYYISLNGWGPPYRPLIFFSFLGVLCIVPYFIGVAFAGLFRRQS